MPCLASGSGKSAPSSLKTVLVVDDDHTTRRILTLMLEKNGFEVATATNGVEALQYLVMNDPPSIILLDLVMPRANGWVFRLEQQKDPRFSDIPVIVLSGAQDPGPAAAFLDADGHIAKPIQAPALMEMIQRVCA